MEILYKVHHGLYVNLTNKCPCACTFCLRQTMDHVGESHSLWLEREPSAEEVIAEFAKFDMDEFEEVVFCGFGEPTEALPVLLKVAAYVKETFAKPVRINTNGMGRSDRYGIHQSQYTECRALSRTCAQQIRRSVF